MRLSSVLDRGLTYVSPDPKNVFSTLHGFSRGGIAWFFSDGTADDGLLTGVLALFGNTSGRFLRMAGRLRICTSSVYGAASNGTRWHGMTFGWVGLAGRWLLGPLVLLGAGVCSGGCESRDCSEGSCALSVRSSSELFGFLFSSCQSEVLFFFVFLFSSVSK